MTTHRFFVLVALLLPSLSAPLPAQAPQQLKLDSGSRVVLMGAGLGSRMVHFGPFETEMHLRYPEHKLVLRNICDEGNTPSFRPHSGRGDQLGFPGAEAFHGPYSDNNTANGAGHFWTDEKWLEHLKPDILVCFFGFSESFEGASGLENFRAELDAFLKHTLAQTYGAGSPPQLALVSPTAFEDRSDSMGVPNGQTQNANLAAYTSVMDTVAAQNGVLFLNSFNPSLRWYAESRKPLTTDSALLNEAGYEHFAKFLIDGLFGAVGSENTEHKAAIQAAVQEKNWFWINDFKMPNGVHVFGRRYNPFGPANYPFEITKMREMTIVRDEAIWAANMGKTFDLAARDAATSALPPVETNYKPSNKNGDIKFLAGEEALKTIEVPEGFAIQQWATEVEFPDLANPVQMSFDNQGRLWVATMPSYPHYLPGDPRPDDKLLILEDTDNDGKADKQTVWADGLHLPMGFEFAPEGVYLSQGINLILLTDTNGDDKADKREVIFSGFDDHDTHHAIGAYCADPSGALMMCEGTFLRTSVETAYGTVRGTNGGFFRFSPQRRHLERHAQLPIPNPWGIAFDDWGQHFFLHTSGPTTEWMLPGSVKPRYGVSTPGSQDLIEPAHRVRPTSGIEFLSSRHFPDDMQGDMLLNNTIGFLGTKQHHMAESGTGFETHWRHDLTKSSDGNYRPVDIEVAPDGSLYLVDWHNPLIGHMQHNARDPHRDHDHGRIYRITYPSRPLVEPAKIVDASIATLLDNLKLPEYRSRYRTRRELRGRDADEVLNALGPWVFSLDANDAGYEHHLLEALWVSWGLDRVDEDLLRRLLKAEDHRARAAAVRVLRYNAHRIPDQQALLVAAASDPHGRVKMEAITAGSWLERDVGLEVLAAVEASYEVGDKEQATEHVVVENRGRTIRISHPALGAGNITSVRMTVPGNNKVINLAEIEILSGGENITARGTFSQSSEYNGAQYPVANLLDDDRSNFSHTAFSDNPWVQATFDPPVSIDTLTIWNRPNFADRFSGARIEFLADQEILTTLEVQIEGGVGVLADSWLRKPFQTAEAHLRGQTIEEKIVIEIPSHLAESAHEQYLRGAEIYARDGHCSTCHQPDGLGLQAGGFPPLAESTWVTEDTDRLIKLTLNGLLGPMEVLGMPYPGLVPMTPFGGLLNNEEIAAVLTYVRNSFGNKASPIQPEKIQEVRVTTQDKVGFYSPDELLGGAATFSRPFVKFWELGDFERDLQGPLHGRSFGTGQAMFEVASCTTCHNMQGKGGNFGADLSEAGKTYSSAELLSHILEPSATVKDEHRLFGIELNDGSRYFGLIVESDKTSITIAEALQEPDKTIFLPRDEIVEMVPLKTSPMPTGLLVTLTHDEILDLLAYITANGNKEHSAFR